MKTRPTISTMSAAELAMHYQLLGDVSFSILDPETGEPVEVAHIWKDFCDTWVIKITRKGAGFDHLELRSAEQVVVAIG